MEVKFNVSQSKLQDWFIDKLASMSPQECLKKLKDCPGVTTPDFEKSSWGSYTQPRDRRKSWELFQATKQNRLQMRVEQRKGYKAFIFSF